MRFIDIQNNGYAGVSFNQPGVTRAQLQQVYDTLVRAQARAIFPTIVTNSVAHMSTCLRTLRELIDADERFGRMFPAFHIEGPCISPVEGYRGAHPQEHIVPASKAVIEPLLEAAGGPGRVAKFTLAPEVDHNLQATAWLHSLGIVVSAGHTDADRSLLLEAEDAGLSFYTHLGNGSAKLMDRHDNIITRVLSLKKMRYSIIPDGHHVPYWLAGCFVRWLGLKRCVFTTDCVSAADAPAGWVMPDPRREVDTSGDTPIVRLKGTPYFAGSALTMPMAHRNAVEHIGLTAAEADWLCCEGPAQMFARWLA